MGILAWIVVGIVAGFLAKAVVPGEGPGGLLGDLVVGIVGALIGGWLFNSFGNAGITGLNLWSILVAFIGGVVLLLIVRLFTRRAAVRLAGVSVTNPTTSDLVRWGADFGPKTTSGEWWRLLTCVFVHIGIVHILLNMWVLTAAGPRLHIAPPRGPVAEDHRCLPKWPQVRTGLCYAAACHERG